MAAGSSLTETVLYDTLVNYLISMARTVESAMNRALDAIVSLENPRTAALPDPRQLGDFFVPGTATLGALADIYGLQVAADHTDVTLADYFNELLRLGIEGNGCAGRERRLDIIHIVTHKSTIAPVMGLN